MIATGVLIYGKDSRQKTQRSLNEICRDLHCTNTSPDRQLDSLVSHPALEGTPCGHEKVPRLLTTLTFLYTRAFLNAYGLWLSQKPSTIISFLHKKSSKRSHWLAHLKSLIDKSLNAMKLFFIECRLQNGLM